MDDNTHIDLSDRHAQSPTAAAIAERPAPKETYDPRTSLRGRVQNQLVRYWMGVGKITIEPPTTSVVPLAGGGYAEIPVPEVSLVRAGANREAPWTGYLDPSIPDHKRLIDSVDAFIAKNPHVQTDARIELIKERPEDAGIPLKKWDHMDPESIKRAYSDVGLNGTLEEAMRYELAKDEKYTEAVTRGATEYELSEMPRTRPDVCVALEHLFQLESSETQDVVEEGVTL